MFDVGFWELLVIGVIALLVVGPERLPGLMRTVGLFVGRARAAFYSVREEVEREIHAEGLRDTQRALRDSVNRTLDDVRKPNTGKRHRDKTTSSAGSTNGEAEARQATDGDASAVGDDEHEPTTSTREQSR